MRKSWFLYLTFTAVVIIIFPALLFAQTDRIEKLIEVGNYQTAYQLLLEELDREPENESILYSLGITASNGSRSSLFLKEYLQKFPDGSRVISARGRLLDYYYAMGLQITAGRLYSDNIDSATPRDLYRAAMIKQQLGALDVAMELYKIAIIRGDVEITAWSFLGLADCDLLKGNYTSAESRFKGYLEIYADSPSFPFSLIGLSETYRRMGEIDLAATYYRLYRERYESSPESDEIKAAILEGELELSDDDLPSIIDAEYFVQVGIFAKKDNAKKCVRKFRNIGYRSKMERFRQGGKSFYKAMIGPYEDRRLASREKAILEKSQGEEYLIILQ
ncbi:MAG: SPOR domain-containing protein [candidate division Zixibacteria bacterium]